MVPSAQQQTPNAAASGKQVALAIQREKNNTRPFSSILARPTPYGLIAGRLQPNPKSKHSPSGIFSTASFRRCAMMKARFVYPWSHR